LRHCRLLVGELTRAVPLRERIIVAALRRAAGDYAAQRCSVLSRARIAQDEGSGPGPAVPGPRVNKANSVAACGSDEESAR